MLRVVMVVLAVFLALPSSSRAEGSGTAGQGAAQPRFRGVVEVYGTSWCGYCKKMRSYLEHKGVRYVVYDIENDDAAYRRFKAMGGDGVPLTVIGSHKVDGYSPQQVDHYLETTK